MNAWKIPFVIGIQTSGKNHLKTRSSRRLKHPDFYALQDTNVPNDDTSFGRDLKHEGFIIFKLDIAGCLEAKVCNEGIEPQPINKNQN
jgi:hypothetical protein